MGALAERQLDAPGEADRSQHLARRLGARRRWLFLATAALGLLAPLALGLLGTADALADALLGRLPLLLDLALYSAVFLALLSLIGLPLSWYGGYATPREFGLLRQSLGGWWRDWLKAMLLALLFETVAVVGLFAAVWSLEAAWWLPYGLVACLVTVALGFVAPYVLVPLFYRMRPLGDPALANRIARLAERAGTRVAGVCELDFSRKTAEANAAVLGFGASRRVVLADTLLREFPPDEIESVVAHELGHHVGRDVPILIGLECVGILAGSWLASVLGEPALAVLGRPPELGEPRNLPWLLVGAQLLGLLALPLVNAISRGLEARADRFALDLVDNPLVFASALRRLARQNLVDERPPRWAEALLASHPSIYRRVALAREYRRARAA